MAGPVGVEGMPMKTTDIVALRAAIDGDRRLLCTALKLRADGKRFFCPVCQCDGERHVDGDFSIEAGFCCHKCGWKGDGLSLVQQVNECKFTAAVEFARAVYHIRDITAPIPPPVPERKAGKIHPTLAEAAKAAAWSAKTNSGHEWRETRRDIYKDAEGKDVAAMLRFDRVDGATDEHGKPVKTYRPVHVVQGGWKTGDPPGLWPLFNLPAILECTGTVYVCEGEKAASAGISIQLCCTTSAHGAKSPRKTDWKPLVGREVIILPDNDASGHEYAETVAMLIETEESL
jgi:hypothetical protein